MQGDAADQETSASLEGLPARVTQYSLSAPLDVSFAGPARPSKAAPTGAEK